MEPTNSTPPAYFTPSNLYQMTNDLGCANVCPGFGCAVHGTGLQQQAFQPDAFVPSGSQPA